MAKPAANEQVLQGTLDLLILKTLSLAPMHGWGLTDRIEQLSNEVLQVGQGSIYPALVNQFILTILASSIASIIGAAELTQQVLFIDSRSFRTIELLAFLTAAYAVLTFTLARIARLLNARLDRAYAR